MAADVRHEVNLAVSVAGYEERDSEPVMSECALAPGEQGRRRDHQRQPGKYFATFGFEAIWIGIDARVEFQDFGSESRFAASQRVGEGALSGARPKGGCWCVHG
jgi:hypothetical protein